MTEIIIATIMRPDGDTGVQTHFNSFREYLNQQQIKHQLITPFSYPIVLVYPVFAVRKIISKFSGSLNVWWYRYWHAFFLWLALKQTLKSGNACVIYAQCPLSAHAALTARVSEKQRVVMVTHFNVSQADEWVGKGLITEGGRCYRDIQSFESSVLPALDGLVFVSGFMQSELGKRIPATAEVPAVIVPNFLRDPGLPEPASGYTADLISIGTLEARKNQQYLLEIIFALKEQGMPLSLTIVGDGQDRSILEEKVKALEINDLVHFTGFVKNAAELITGHKACIHVAIIENLPITLVEALARGKPVFAAAVGGIPEVIGDGVVGLFLPLNDASAAAKIIANAINNREWMDKASCAGRKRFVNRYTSDVCAKKLTDFLKNIGNSSEAMH